MNIITSNPIINETDFNQEDYFNLFGETAQRRRKARQSSRQKTKVKRQGEKQKRRKTDGTFLQKVGRGAESFAQSGILDTLAGLGQQTDVNGMDMNTLPPQDAPISLLPTNTEETMSTGKKVAIGVAVIAALTIGTYFIVKMKTKKGGK